jgi:hypothetical protein
LGKDITNWTDDTEQLSWHESPLITGTPTERTIPTFDTSNDNSSHTPTLGADTFTNSYDPFTPTNDKYGTHPPSHPSTQAPIITHCTHFPSPRQLDISTFATQNTHGLRRLPRDATGKLITTKPYNYTRYEHLITMMKTKSLDIYFVQKTWLEGDAVDEIINGYHIFRQNGGKGNHNLGGFAIILLPRYYKVWKAARAKPLLTSDVTGEFAGRYISINVTLNSYDRLGK